MWLHNKKAHLSLPQQVTFTILQNNSAKTILIHSNRIPTSEPQRASMLNLEGFVCPTNLRVHLTDQIRDTVLSRQGFRIGLRMLLRDKMTCTKFNRDKSKTMRSRDMQSFLSKESFIISVLIQKSTQVRIRILECHWAKW